MRMALTFLFVTAGVAAVIWHVGGADKANAKAEEPVRWIIHYADFTRDASTHAHADLLRKAPQGVEIVAVVSSEADAKRLRASSKGKARIIRVARKLSPWARDRYIVYPRDGKTYCMMLTEDAMPAAARGDADVPGALRALYPDLVIVRTPLAPEGGDVIVTRRGVIIGHASVAGAARRMNMSVHAVVAELERLFGRRLVVVGRRWGSRLPPHLDQFIAGAGGDRLLVADVAPADTAKAYPELAQRGDFRRQFNDLLAVELNTITAQLASAGYKIHRVPTLFSARAKGTERYPLNLTYLNAIREGTQVFVPSYGYPDLDRAGRAAWEQLGFTTVAIRADRALLYGGAVRCLTNRFPAESDI